MSNLIRKIFNYLYIFRIGGIRKACLLVESKKGYEMLKFEGGIHRVQRVPKTETKGRIHTSTAVVALMPVPSEVSFYNFFKLD